MSWQPIETAPKDKVILLCNSKNIRTAWWEKEGWTVAKTERVVALIADPTHWMALPPLPGVKETGKAGVAAMLRHETTPE